MAALVNPTSLQLRFCHRCRESSLVSLRIQFRPSIRRMRLVSCNGGGGSSLPVSFAGWSEDSSTGDDGDSDKAGGLGGMLGAVLAGVLFAAGVTFASLSLSSRSTQGAKQLMEPLTAEQEVLLTSDDQGEKVVQVGNESNVMLPDDRSKPIDSNSEDGKDSTHHTSDYQDKHSRDEDFPLDFSSSRLLGSGEEYSQISSREVVDNTPSESMNQSIEHNEMLEVPAEANSLTKAVHDIPSAVPSSTISISEFKQNEALTLREEANVEGQIIDDNTLSAAYSESVIADPNGNEPVISSHGQIARSSILESVLPKRTVSYAGIPAPSLVSASLQASPAKYWFLQGWTRARHCLFCKF